MGADFHFPVRQTTSFERRIIVGLIDVGLVAVGIDVVGVAVVGVTAGLAVDVAAVIALSVIVVETYINIRDISAMTDSDCR